MNRYLLTLLFAWTTLGLLAQDVFNPDKSLMELSGNKKNIGITAGYSVEGETKWSGAAGYTCKDAQTPFSSITLTRIASISKCFTAVAIMQLVEQGEVKLDGAIGEYLKDIPEDKKKITVRQLLSHTGGISQYQGKKEIENTIHYPTLQEAMEVFIHRPLMSEPGTKYFYTTYGYVILGCIIETSSGLSYEDYIQKHVFDVAEMRNTGVERIGEKYPNKSCLFHHTGKKAKDGKQNDLSNRVPGGGFYSTLEDLIKFGNALVDGKLIKQESLDAMRESQPVTYDGNKYGLGWFLYAQAPNEGLVIGHSGGQTGCTSQLLIVPKSKTVAVVLSNTSRNYPEIVGFASKLIQRSEAENK